MKFLGMGVPELLIILAVALLIFGPKNLPKLGASLGKTVKNIRDGMSDSDKDGKKDTKKSKSDEEEEPEKIEESSDKGSSDKDDKEESDSK